MVIQLDRCYKITFRNEADGAGANFSLLDGFYEVVRCYGWNELMGAGIDLQENLLDHAGITDSTALRSLKQNWANDSFYLCIGMDEDRQIWVPSSIIKGYPEPRIGSYKKLGLVLDLGVFANQDDFATLGKDIMNYLRSNYGIDRPDATVTVYGNQWLTVDEYENTDLVRKSLQGLAYTTQRVLIDPSEELKETVVTFTKPSIVGIGTVIEGAISDSIKVTYGLDLANIPEGEAMNLSDMDQATINETGMQWGYNNQQILSTNTDIERENNINFNGCVLSGILLYTKFTRSAYKWRCGDSVIYTIRLAPSGTVQIFSDSTLTAPITGYTISCDNVNKTLTLTKDNVTSVYKFDDSNKTAVDITYRFRNAKVGTPSSYSQALKYAYENIELKRKIETLEAYIEQQSSNN